MLNLEVGKVHDLTPVFTIDGEDTPDATLLSASQVEPEQNPSTALDLRGAEVGAVFEVSYQCSVLFPGGVQTTITLTDTVTCIAPAVEETAAPEPAPEPAPVDTPQAPDPTPQHTYGGRLSFDNEPIASQVTEG